MVLNLIITAPQTPLVSLSAHAFACWFLFNLLFFVIYVKHAYTFSNKELLLHSHIPAQDAIITVLLLP